MAAALVVLAPVSASAAENPTVTVDPPRAPAGVQVIATASGFDGCVVTPVETQGPQVELGPHVELLLMADPLTTSVYRLLSSAESTEPGEVRILWDDEDVVGAAEVSGGSAEVLFTIPTDASPGPHVVTARCLDGSVVGRTVVEVEPPMVMPTIVPPVTGLTVAEAGVVLKEAELILGETTGDGELIEDQSPEAGAEAERGSTVDVVLGEAPPTLVEVPLLRDLDREEARRELEAANLVLGNVTGTGVVDAQSHAPGVLVPAGTAVDVSLVTPGLVPVPRLVGMQLDEASERLADRDLMLAQVSGDDPQPDSVVRRQRPAPGTLVQSGSARRHREPRPERVEAYGDGAAALYEGARSRPLWPDDAVRLRIVARHLCQHEIPVCEPLRGRRTADRRAVARGRGAA